MKRLSNGYAHQESLAVWRDVIDGVADVRTGHCRVESEREQPRGRSCSEGCERSDRHRHDCAAVGRGIEQLLAITPPARPGATAVGDPYSRFWLVHSRDVDFRDRAALVGRVRQPLGIWREPGTLLVELRVPEDSLFSIAREWF